MWCLFMSVQCVQCHVLCQFHRTATADRERMSPSSSVALTLEEGGFPFVDGCMPTDPHYGRS